MLWFDAVGGSAIHTELFGAGGYSEQVFADVSAALYAFFEYFPRTVVLSFLAVVLAFIFLDKVERRSDEELPGRY